MQWKKKKAVKPHEMGLYSSPQAIRTRYCQKFSKQICLYDLAQGIGILLIIQIVEAI